MTPRSRVTLRIERRIEARGEHRLIHVVRKVIRARPDELHGLADLLGQQSRIARVFVDDASTKATAQ